MSGLRIRSLGTFRVERDGHALDLGGPLPRALLMVLAAAEGRTVSVSRLVDELWEDPPSTAESTLASYVSRLRRVLAPAGSGPVLQRQGSGYALVLPPSAYDAASFRSLCARAEEALQADRAGEALARYDEALSLWDDGALDASALPRGGRPEAVRLREERSAAQEARFDARLRLGLHEATVGELAAAVTAHPGRERLSQLLALALYRSGRAEDALAVIRDAVQRLDDEHGLEPRPELRALERAVLSKEPSLDAPPPSVGRPAASPAGAAAAGPRRLPVPLTALVGRERCVRDVQEQLRDHRLVTLTGPGGTGKTRLAVHLARSAAPSAASRAADVVWAPLADVARPELVEQALADAVGATGQPGVPLRVATAAALQDRCALVVLDNAEHVLSAASAAVAALLGDVPDARVLVTSRSPLGVAGERVVEVAPLAVEHGIGEANAALRLFLDRAAAVAPDWQPDARELQASEELCRRLDGLPLALELAAARCRDLSPEEILDGLHRWPDMLAGTAGASTPHHTSLDRAVSWSYDLLREDDARVFRTLAALDGTFDLSVATAIAGPQAVGAVARLAGSSLLVCDRSVQPRRYGMLTVLREWGRARTPAHEVVAVDRALAVWAADLAHAARPALHRCSSEAGVALRRIDRDMPNLRRALTPASGEGDALLAVQTADDLSVHWQRGIPAEGIDLLLAALARLEATGAGETSSTGSALLATAQLAWAQGDVATGLACATRARETSARTGPPLVEAISAAAASYMLLLGGQAEEAVRAAADASELAERLAGRDHDEARGNVLVVQAVLADVRGDARTALELADLAVAAARAADEWPLLLAAAYYAERVALSLGLGERVLSRAAHAALLAAEIGVETSLLVQAQLTAGGLAAVGRGEHGASLLGAAASHGRRLGIEPGYTDPQYSQWLDEAVQRSVDPAVFRRAFAAGAAWDRHDLVQALAALAPDAGAGVPGVLRLVPDVEDTAPAAG